MTLFTSKAPDGTVTVVPRMRRVRGKVHGRDCELINGRWYAVEKRVTLAEYIANNTGSTGNAVERVQRSARNNHSRGFR